MPSAQNLDLDFLAQHTEGQDLDLDFLASAIGAPEKPGYVAPPTNYTGEILGAYGEAGKSVARGAIDAAATIPQGMAFGAKKLDEVAFGGENYGNKPVSDLALFKLGSTAKQYWDGKLAPKEGATGAEKFVQQDLPAAIGSTTVYALGGGPAGIATLGAASSSGDFYQDAIDEGFNEEAAKDIASIGAIVGTTEALPFEDVLRSSSVMRKYIAKKLVREIASQSAEEGLQEGLQGIAQYVAKESLKQPEKSTVELYADALQDPEIAKQALVGAMTGGIMAGGTQALEAIDRQRQRPAPMAPEPGAPSVETGDPTGATASPTTEQDAPLFGLRRGDARESGKGRVFTPGGALTVKSQERGAQEQAEVAAEIAKEIEGKKAVLLTPEGAAAWSQANPEKAAAIVAKESPSRKDFGDVGGVLKWTQEERKKFRDLLAGAEKRSAAATAPPVAEQAEDDLASLVRSAFSKLLPASPVATKSERRDPADDESDFFDPENFGRRPGWTEFSYKAQAEDGSLVEGVDVAPDEEHLIHRLRNQGLSPVSIEAVLQIDSQQGGGDPNEEGRQEGQGREGLLTSAPTVEVPSPVSTEAGPPTTEKKPAKKPAKKDPSTWGKKPTESKAPVEQVVVPAVEAPKGEEIPAPKAAETGPRVLSERIADALQKRADEKSSAPMDWREFFAIADEAMGGTRAEGKYTAPDAYDAMEAGLNLFLLRSNDPEAYKYASLLPTQTVRDEEKTTFQQFSTPAEYASAVADVANIRPGETVLEPSAGTGNLAIQAKKRGARVVANELSPRRTELLRGLGMDKVLTEDAEQIGNIIAEGDRPTVVIMNPPFSRAGHLTGDKKDMQVAPRHLDAALSALKDGGRLVAIVGRGMADTSKQYRDWWDATKAKHTVRANVAVDGSVYAKNGTSFGTRVLVIDKVPPTGDNQIVTGEAKTIAELGELLKGVRDGRATEEQPKPGKLSGEAGVEGTGGKPGPVAVVPPAAGAGGGGTPSRTGKPQRNQEPTGNDAGVGPTKRGPRAAGGGRGTAGGTTEGAGAVPGGTSVPSDAGGVPAVPERPERLNVESKQREKKEKPKADVSDAVFEAYVPSKVHIPGAIRHPASIVESAAMASVSAPDPTYSPNLPAEVTGKGLLSDVQLENVVYAGQAHEQMLPHEKGETAFRRGYMIGDGTGVGKGRQIAGIILDNFRQGRTKALWISERTPLLQDARRDWEDIGGSKDDIFTMPKPGTQVKAGKGILFATYTLMAGKPSKNAPEGTKTRLDQIVEWLGEDFDGVIAFDEAHNMRNAIRMKGKRGYTEPSQIALAGVELQRRLPNARVVYVSATAATEVSNMSYADRLGLWGRGTPFPNKAEFISQIGAGGIAAMEVVARDLKAMGSYLARSISYNDGTPEGTVEYERLEHVLKPNQRKNYDTLALAWQGVLRRIEDALKITNGNKDRNAKGAAKSAFWSGHQRFFNQVITSLQTPSVVSAIEKDLAEGRSAVIQIVNTNEASQERAIGKMNEGDVLEDLDLSPREILLQLVANSFPTAQYELYTDEDGNERSRPVLDSAGNPVQNKEAVEMRDKLLDDLARLEVAENPIDIIINHFGTDVVSEVTGRSRRLVNKTDTDGNVTKALETRPGSSNEAEATAFMSGKKRILIFSDAGGTGRSYHADRRAKNQQQRSHYLLQPGWRADKALQGMGRTHRSNQKQAPRYVLPTTDLKGQKRFISSVARRLDQLGALTRGQRQAGSTGIFTAADNLESNLAKDALGQFFNDVFNDKVPGVSLKKFQDETGLELTDNRGGMKSDLPEITQFMNRLLSMTIDTQNAVFAYFEQIIEDKTELARQQGTLDLGVESFRADSIMKDDEQVVYTDPRSKAETKYVRLAVKTRQRVWLFGDVNSGKAPGAKKPLFYVRSKKSGKIFAIMETANKSDGTGEIIPQYRKMDTLGYELVPRKAIDSSENFVKLTEDEAETLWGEAADKTPKFKDSTEHVITGALLPIWNRLPGGSSRIIRFTTDDGEQLLGRVIEPKNVANTLRALGATAKKQTFTNAQLVEKLMDNTATVELANGWKIKRAMVGGSNRIEIEGPTYSDRGLLSGEGVFTEQISFRTRFFIPTGEDAESVFSAVTKDRPVVDVQELYSSAADQAMRNADRRGQGIVPGPLAEIFQRNQPLPFEKGKSDLPLADEALAPTEDQERRLRAAHGLPTPSKWERFRDTVAMGYRMATRAQQHIPNNSKFAVANEFFRQLKNIASASSDEAARRVAAVAKPLSQRELAFFERVLLVENLWASVERGEPKRFGFEDKDQLLSYLEHLRELSEQVPAVKEALARRKAIVTEVVGGLVDLGLLPADAMDRADTYFHQQVGEKMAERVATAAKAEKVKRTFQKKRVTGVESFGEEYDYNASYLEAETSWLRDALHEMRKAQELERLDKAYGILGRLKAEVKDKNFEQLVGGKKVVRRIMKLRAMIKESVAVDGADGAEQRKFWIQELQEIDPTYPYRVRIARMMGKLQKMAQDGLIDASKWPGAKDMEDVADVAEIELMGRKALRFLSWLAETQGDETPGIVAKGIFKAIDDRNRMIRERLGEKYLTWQRAIPEGYAAWQPEPGNYFYAAATLPQRTIEQIQAGMIQAGDIKPEDIRYVLAMGGARPSFVLPEEIALQLQDLAKPKPSSMPAQAVSTVLGSWKAWMMVAPHRVVGASTRNAVGDAEIVVAGAPGARKYLIAAAKELRSYYFGDKVAVSENLRKARDLGVLSASMAAQDIPDIKDIPLFAKFLTDDEIRGKLRSPGGLLAKWMETTKRANEFREAIARYALFQHYQEQMKSGGKLPHYGGAKPEVVEAIRAQLGVDAAAAYMSRNLIGDYSNLTVMGQFLRTKIMPFYAFMEINLKRYPRLFMNAVASPGRKGATGRVLGVAALKAAGRVLRIGAFLGALWLFNVLFHPDIERELPAYERANPHLILGRTEDGRAIIMRNMSTLGDFMEWFGINDAMSMAPEMAAGQVSAGDVATTMAKAPVNKVVGGVGPHIKGPIEFITGQSLFPDAFSPRRIERDQVVKSTLGLPEMGKLSRDPVRFMGPAVVDPRESAIREMWDLRAKYLKKQNKETPAVQSTGAFRPLREAVALQDYEAFVAARKEYLAQGKGYENFLASLKNLDPIAARLSDEDERKFEQEFLTGVQRNKLKVARDYAHTLEVAAWLWWQKAAQDDPAQPEATKKELSSKAAFLSGSIPTKKADRDEWLAKRDETLQFMRERGIKAADVQKAYAEKLRAEKVTNRAERLQRLARQLRRLEQPPAAP